MAAAINIGCRSKKCFERSKKVCSNSFVMKHEKSRVGKNPTVSNYLFPRRISTKTGTIISSGMDITYSRIQHEMQIFSRPGLYFVVMRILIASSS